MKDVTLPFITMSVVSTCPLMDTRGSENELPIPTRFPGRRKMAYLSLGLPIGLGISVKTFQHSVRRHIFEHESTLLIRNRFFKQVIRTNETREEFVAQWMQPQNLGPWMKSLN